MNVPTTRVWSAVTADTGRPLLVQKRLWTAFYFCFCRVCNGRHTNPFICSSANSLQEEAVSYYTKREAKLKEEYRKEKEKVHTKPLGMAFVTFQNEAMTAM